MLAANAGLVGWECASSSCCDDCVEEEGTSSLTMACSMAGLTLNVFNCRLRSDLAPFGAFLVEISVSVGSQRKQQPDHLPEKLNDSRLGRLTDGGVSIFQQFHERGNIAPKL